MPIQKPIPYKILLQKLIASKKLSKAEQKAFIEMGNHVSKGNKLDPHQELWIEALTKKYL